MQARSSITAGTKPPMRSRGGRGQVHRGHGHRGAGHVKRAVDNDEDGTADVDENDDDYLEKAVKHMLRIQRVKKVSEADWGKTVPVNIGDIPALVENDRGADANFMDEAQHRALLKRGGKTTPLEKTGEGIRGFQATLEPVGEFYTVVNNPIRGVKTKFKGSIDSPPPLSRETST